MRSDRVPTEVSTDWPANALAPSPPRCTQTTTWWLRSDPLLRNLDELRARLSIYKWLGKCAFRAFRRLGTDSDRGRQQCSPPASCLGERVVATTPAAGASSLCEPRWSAW